MIRRGLAALLSLGLVLGIPFGVGPSGVAEAPPTESESSARLRGAIAIQAATRARLSVADGPTCADATVVSYRRSDAMPSVADQWYVASQLWADTELIRTAAAREAQMERRFGRASTEGADRNERDARCYVDKSLAFLDRLTAEDGGHFPRSDPSGLEVERAVRYADDNAVAGLALLAVAEAEPDPTARQRHLDAARAQADFLIRSGVWDETFGGGFWWNTNFGDRYEGKPAQTNAAAALFFARLHAATDEPAYREWALRTLDWLDQVLWDPDRQLYRWSIRYEDPSTRSGPPVVSWRYFNYDQSIAIEAQLLGASLDGDRRRLQKARALGRALHRSFWNSRRGGYNLTSGIERVYTSYAAWTSLGHLALYDLDGDPGWLDLARLNADALAATMREPDGGYAYRHYRCVTLVQPGCERGEGTWVLDRTRDASAQAWMQHLEAAIAARIEAPRRPRLIEAAAPARPNL